MFAFADSFFFLLFVVAVDVRSKRKTDVACAPPTAAGHSNTEGSILCLAEFCFFEIDISLALIASVPFPLPASVNAKQHRFIECLPSPFFC